MENLFQLIDVGGDVGIWFLLLAIWKNDRRILKLEINLNHHLQAEHE